MRVFNDNSMCSCKSGLKYVDCCKPFQKFFDKYNITNYDENYVLKTVLQNSKEFFDFYQNERHKIKDPIIWNLDVNLNATLRSKYIDDGNGNKINMITLKEVPVNLTNSFDVIHDICHIINGYKGYPSVRIKTYYEGNTTYEWIGNVFISMINDLAINKQLVEMGLDFKTYYNKASKIQINILMNILSQHKKEDELYAIFVTSQKLVEWDFIENKEESPYIIALRNRFPELEKDVIYLYNLINKIGYNTGEKAIELGKEIIELYNLKYLKLIC